MNWKINLKDNLFLKLLSLVIAVLLWLVVMSVSDVRVSNTYLMEVQMINTEGLAEEGNVYRVEGNSNFVKMTVRGKKSVMEKLEPTDFVLTADMKKNLRFEEQVVAIEIQCKNNDINIERDVTLNRYNVEVRVEKEKTEQFPISVSQVGKENAGLKVGELVAEQTVVKISGPISIVENIKRVEAVVDVTGLTGSTVKTCNLKLTDGDGDPIDTTYLNYVGKAEGFDVKVNMLKTKQVPIMCSYEGIPAEGYEVVEFSWKPDAVLIAAEEAVLAGISKIEIPAEAVNVGNATKELQVIVDLKQYLPPSVQLFNEKDSSILVIANVEKILQQEDTENIMKQEKENE